MQSHLLTILILLPIIGAATTVAYSFTPGAREPHHRWIALGFTTISFLASLLLIQGAGGGIAAFRFAENYSWIASIGARYHLGVDGISLWLVLLTTLLMPIAVLSSWTAVTKRPLTYYVLMLLLESAMIGVFVSLDLLLFYLFFEASLVPMFFLIGIWGGERRIYAAIKFFIYTSVGSLLMLVGIIALFFVYNTFDYTAISAAMQHGQTVASLRSYGYEMALFWGFALAFMIKVPVFPFHTWLPDAHTEAPTAGSVILAGVLLKMGTYGLLRFNLGLFPEQSRQNASWIIALAVIGIVYGALVAMVQPNLKKLIAYSSVSHLGFVVLGIFSFTQAGLNGALFVMLAHGISTGGLFMLAGILHERRHTYEIREFGGLAAPSDIYAASFLFIVLASVGLPLLNGFVGEFLVLSGAFQARALYGILAATGVIWSACYLLWMYQRVFFGKITVPANNSLSDLSRLEKAAVWPCAAAALVMGVAPLLWLNALDPAVQSALTPFAQVISKVVGR